jgi:predicted  nucleic acid-binding Zn-ribbon protein
MASQQIDQFSSPVRKLLPFFRKSRDRWKAKYKQLQMTCKLLRNQTRAVENSRESWRERAEAAEARLAEMTQELEQLKFQR